MVTTTEGRESPRVAHRFLVPRLSLMMFMQFFIWGSWSVTLGLVMTRYEMSLLIGDAFSAGPIASILSPFVLGMLVDRFFASQKVMAVMHLAGAVILWFVPQALVAQNGALLIGLLFGYTLCYMPTLALTNNIAFHSLANVDKTFPVVRVFGTIGWIIAGIFIGVTGISDTTGIFTLAALCSAALAVYSLTLPHTPAPAKGTPVQFRDLLCADAFALLKTRHFLIFSLCATLISIPLGVSEEGRFLLYLGILLHGVCYDFFFVVGFIYTDRVAGEKVKGQAQSMIVMFTYGIGMLLGSQISGALYNHLVAGQSVPQAWVTFWWIPAVAAAVIALIFLFSFQYNEKEQR
ncbi:MFS transporter [Klebsiella michiganensis]|nr:MFS transporter [Klebsiella michiganensis]